MKSSPTDRDLAVSPWQEPDHLVFDLAGANLVEVRLPPDVLIPPHGHENPHCCLVVQGEIIECEGAKPSRVLAGGVRHSPAGDRHVIRSGSIGATCFVAVAPDAKGMNPPRRHYGRGNALSELASELHRGVRQGMSHGVNDPARDPSARLAGVMAELFAVGRRLSTPRAAEQPPLWLIQAREALEAGFRDPPTLAELASEVGVHRGQLTRAFRDHYGCSIGSRVRLLQIEAARQLLLSSSLSLTQVAMATGHADQSHLTRRIGAAFGVTPGEMRRAASQKR